MIFTALGPLAVKSTSPRVEETMPRLITLATILLLLPCIGAQHMTTMLILSAPEHGAPSVRSTLRDTTPLDWSGLKTTCSLGSMAVCEYVWPQFLPSNIPLIRVFHSQQVLFFNFKKAGSLWTYGGFSSDTVNGSAPTDPWSQTGRDNTPFDQPFYLILSVAVGATNGYFP